MTDQMIDSRTASRIIEKSKEKAFWHREEDHSALKTVKTDHSVKKAKSDPHKIVVHEGSADRWVDVRAVNFVTIALWDPKLAFELINVAAPDNGQSLIDKYISKQMINAPVVQVKEDLIDVARPDGYIRDAAHLAAYLTGDTRQDNYVYRLYRALAVSETKLNLATNPVGETSKFYGWEGPVRIVVEESEDINQSVSDAGSATEANW